MKSYKLTIDLATLKHLGIGLYSNVPAVLSEVVANSWDANARHVNITIDEKSTCISVKDDGWGMTEEEINNRFLKVGYRKRDDPTAPKLKGRLPMGRKGIGKLALFSIADSIEVHSVKLNSRKEVIERNGFIMRASAIEHAMKNGRTDYAPEPIPENKVTIKEGTLITIRDLKTGGTVTEAFLRKRIARRFGIIGESFGFKIQVNGKPILLEDRDFFGRLEYIWCVGKGSELFIRQARRVLRHETLPGVIDEDNDYCVTGWVGTTAEHKAVEQGNNGIAVFARGKVIHENLLPDLKEGRVFSKYIIGELRADFLDLDNRDDIATSDRQSVKDTDPRFEALKTFVKNVILNRIGNVWTEWRNEDQSKEALKNPAIEAWFSELRPQHRKYAKSLLGRIAGFPVEDDELRRTLYRHGILAFETLAAKDNLDALTRIDSHADLERLLELFKDFDELEAAHYWHITKTRVAVLQKFEKIAPMARETVIRDYIFDHLWLLDTSWERASTDRKMEESVTKEWKKLDAGLTTDEKRGRIDIRYRTAAGKHIIIELKKYDRAVTAEELSTQVRKYQTALRKCLLKAYPDEKEHAIETICLLGSPPLPADQNKMNRELLAASQTRYITYDQLIRQTRESYSDYLETNTKLSRIQKLVERI
ncbi:MAG: ATP-binding protein [Nitrospira sp.]|nr:ATP-binding protein [Nitrospira sp.]